MTITGISLGKRPANERHHYNVTMSLIGWAHTYTDPCHYHISLYPHSYLVFVLLGHMESFFELPIYSH